jgi:hypothetical protein
VKKQLRQLSIDGVKLKWRVTHRRKPTSDSLEGAVCVDQLVVFRQATSRSPFRIVFTEGAEGGPEYVSRGGVVTLYSNKLLLNLHKPKTVEILTRRALELGWSERAAMQIDDGFSFVRALPIGAQHLIDENYEPHTQTA